MTPPIFANLDAVVYGRVSATWNLQSAARKDVVLGSLFAKVSERSRSNAAKLNAVAQPATDMLNQTVEDFDEADMEEIRLAKEQRMLDREARAPQPTSPPAVASSPSPVTLPPVTPPPVALPPVAPPVNSQSQQQPESARNNAQDDNPPNPAIDEYDDDHDDEHDENDDYEFDE
jgi:hypothetical protein